MTEVKPEYSCTGMCLFGKCPFDECIKYKSKAHKMSEEQAGKMHILTDTSRDLPKADGEGYALAIDIGTTTVVAYLCDMKDSKIITTVSRINAQVPFGLDVISRIKYCMDHDDGLEAQHEAVASQLNAFLDIAEKAGYGRTDITRVVIAGNTTMEHLFTKEDPTGMGVIPFAPASLFGRHYAPQQLGINLDTDIYIAPCVSAFVGGDITAAVLASGMHEKEGLSLLIDIGTNGEIVLGGKDGFFTTSTAAGPAFEGAQIQFGSGGVAGAINKVYPLQGKIAYDTINDEPAMGICGSGLIDAVAVMLDTGVLDETGRIVKEHPLYSEYKGEPAFAIEEGKIYITQKDIRMLQPAKSAIAAGVRTLLKQAGKTVDDIQTVYLAGGFGNYMDRESALKIGLLPPLPLERIVPIGNAAGTGALLAALRKDNIEQIMRIRDMCTAVDLATDAYFMEQYVEHMYFGDIES